MMILIPIITSPKVVPNFLLKNIAKTSVPSITAPPLTAMPMPAPRKNPPNMATSKLSSVIFGNSTNPTTMANPEIANAVLIANTLPSVLYPIIINGIFTNIMSIYKGIFVMAEINKEIPVAPPSIK